MVDVETDSGYKLTIFAVHHKAGGREQMHHREAEALKIVEMLTELQTKLPSRNIIVMGDFNCAPWDKSMRVYLQNGMIDTLAFRTTDRDDPESRLYKTHESDRVLDYILMNSAAYRELVLGSPHVFGTLTPPSSYDYQKDPQPPGYASDHYPVIVDMTPKENS
jgi:endonuclease/exonuclease/phosphatase family metal-dependent hydrolase